MSEDTAHLQKLADPYTFIPADEFFQSLNKPASGAQRPNTVVKHSHDHDQAGAGELRLTFDDDSTLGLQFVRPKLWRILRPQNAIKDTHRLTSRNVVQKDVGSLVQVLSWLDEPWTAQLIEDEHFLIYQSVLTKQPKRIATQLWIRKSPFQISAVQSVESVPGRGRISHLSCDNAEARLPEVQGKHSLIVWETNPHPLCSMELATILSVRKRPTAAYVGFGEQGGDTLLRHQTFMNFFNYDNMLYSGVYGQGALDPREPLYHSEPFWVEVNALPGYMSKVGTFVDNYSHVALDVGKTDPNELRIATRFGDACIYIMAGSTLSDVIDMYTSIVGRPWLKPRYALGYGQGSYGYDTREKVETAVGKYQQNDFPIDTMHIDVDLQDQYCTFTINERAFPDPQGMFRQLKSAGVKCSTNITPVINATVPYPVQEELLYNKLYVPDRRYISGISTLAENQRYICYEGGERIVVNPSLDRPGFGDDYEFANHFNKGVPYRGGVNYGAVRGTAGYYPDLNREVVRKWWGDQYRYLFETGLSFVWQDMTSPSISKEYGDMKSFPARLLLPGDQDESKLQPAIELWSLYAYNLHKATFHGLNRLPTQKGKRNYIIGRGSFPGMHRYAGLWTGDNGSSWDFLRIIIVQSLALGFSGLVMTGGDVGGFMGMNKQKFAAPDLLIRWYCAAFLLPWFRNHYNGKPGEKLFQEPYAYEPYYRKHRDEIGEDQEYLYQKVLPATRWYTKFRYSLIQMLYDGLFENIKTGLPIVSALMISDPLDETLYDENLSFLSDEYMVRNNLLVAPILKETHSQRGWRTVYLPGPDAWFPCNLRWDSPPGTPLAKKQPGGTRIKVAARLTDRSFEKLTPIFIREGAIFPTQEPRNHVPDPTTEERVCSPITIHVYPGKDHQYDMYLDDGVSRDSAPASSFLPGTASDSSKPKALVADPEAKSCYRHVRISSETTSSDSDSSDSTYRDITITNIWDGYGVENVRRDIGQTYDVILWQESAEKVQGRVQVSGAEDYQVRPDRRLRAIIVMVSVDPNETGGTIRIRHYLD